MVLKGQMEFIVNGEKRLLQEGDSISPLIPYTFNNQQQFITLAKYS
jgi:hypothetical protein